MKKSALIALSMVLLCCLLTLQTTLVSAFSEGYQTTNYSATDEPVIDGAFTEGDWSYDNEWSDTDTPPLLPATFSWREKWTWPENIMEHFLVEALTDNTTDAGDYFELCVDGDASGGSAPGAGDLKLLYMGDKTLTVYMGDGEGWVEYADYTVPDEIQVEDSIDSSPTESNPHWIIELTMDRTKFDVSESGYQPGVRLAVYDVSNDAAGVQAWPLDSSPDAPDEWGQEFGTTEQIPEALTVSVVILLSSIAVAVSFYCLRRRPQLRVATKQ